MTVQPNGSPSWTGTNAFTDLDGHVEKENRTGFGPPNPKQDLTAEGQSRLHQIVEAAGWAMPFATIRFTLNDTEEENPSVLTYKAQHGSGVSNAPTLTRYDDGYCEVQWASSYSDAFGVPGAVSISAAQVTGEGSALSVIPSYTLEDAQTVFVYGDDNGTFTLTVWNGGTE